MLNFYMSTNEPSINNLIHVDLDKINSTIKSYSLDEYIGEEFKIYQGFHTPYTVLMDTYDDYNYAVLFIDTNNIKKSCIMPCNSYEDCIKLISNTLSGIKVTDNYALLTECRVVLPRELFVLYGIELTPTLSLEEEVDSPTEKDLLGIKNKLLAFKLNNAKYITS